MYKEEMDRGRKLGGCVYKGDEHGRKD